MKRLFILIFIVLISTMQYAQETVRLISSTGNTVTIARTITNTETYVKLSPEQTIQSVKQKQTGNIGIAIHSGYNLKNSIEFGGSLFYNFSGKANGNFGISVGYDYGASQWWNPNMSFVQNYWHGRAGFVICKYIGIGGVYGKTYDINRDQINDYGAYTTIYLPICKYFGLNLDGKWTNKNNFTIGGGFIFTIPTKI